MELFLLVSMVFTMVTFSLIVLSEPVAPMTAKIENDMFSDFAQAEPMTDHSFAAGNSIPDRSAAPKPALAL